jgi:hypothetical protein
MVAEHARSTSSAEGFKAIDFDRDTREQLEALGYLGAK